MVDGFAAEPGTMAGYEEFRGTGGSLYYLHHQDILTGSERVRIEMRDKDSGIVTGVVNLRPGLDYDIDYLQGRVMLSEPLSSMADDNLLVRSSGLERRRGVPRRALRVHAGLRRARRRGGRRPGPLLVNDHVSSA